MDSWHKEIEAEDAFRTAQGAVAKIRAKDMGELGLKACLGCVYDVVRLGGVGNSALIGYSVALDLIRLIDPVAS